MSEYQYYEFAAVDRQLTSEEIAGLRELSTSADISETRFVDRYDEYGRAEFRGSQNTFMERYFDAHLYRSTWGTHELMFRVPATALDIEVARKYVGMGHETTLLVHGEHIIMELRVEHEPGAFDHYDGPDTLSSFISARAELIAGDRRLLYLAWLVDVDCASDEELDMDEVEPPVPPGLGSLSGSLEAIVQFLHLDLDLLEVARQGDETSRRTVGELRERAAARRAAV